MAPAGLSGAATEAPAIDRLTGPAPPRRAPNCARAGAAARITVSTATALAGRASMGHLGGRDGLPGLYRSHRSCGRPGLKELRGSDGRRLPVRPTRPVAGI